MSDSGEFQEIESNYSGNFSHVPGQRAVIPSPRSMPSRDKRLPFDTWNLSEPQGNGNGNPRPMFGSSQTPYHGILHSTSPSATGAIPVQRSAGRPVAKGEERIGSTTPMPMSARRPSIMSSFLPVEVPHNSMAGQRTPSSFMYWKIRFQTQVSSRSDSPLDATLWIKEVEMVDSVDDFNSSRSIDGDFELLDARIASALNKIIQISHFKRRSVWRNRKPRKRIGFYEEDIYDYFRVTGAHGTVLDYADLCSVHLRNDIVQDFDTGWDEILLFLTKIPSDDVLESLYKLRKRESAQLKTVLELYDMEIHQKISMPNCQKLKTMVKKGA